MMTSDSDEMIRQASERFTNAMTSKLVEARLDGYATALRQVLEMIEVGISPYSMGATIRVFVKQAEAERVNATQTANQIEPKPQLMIRRERCDVCGGMGSKRSISARRAETRPCIACNGTGLR